MNRNVTWRLASAMAVVGILTCGVQAQDSGTVVRDYHTGQVVNSVTVDLGKPVSSEVLTLYSLQSYQTGRVSNVGTEAFVYQAIDAEPLTYSVFLNFNASTGLLFPGTMMGDNCGLGNGFEANVSEISSYTARLFRSSLDPQPGLADFHMELWDGDPFASFDTPGLGFTNLVVPGTEADIVDVPGATQFTATALLAKGVTAPNTTVWMVVSGSETGVNPSPCRLGWDIAYQTAAIGNHNPSGDLVIAQSDDTGLGVCCEDGATACDVTGGVPCTGDIGTCSDGSDGCRGFCQDGDAEAPAGFTIGGSQCALHGGAGFCSNFTASISSPATATYSLVEAGSGNTAINTVGGGSLELEIMASNWDPTAAGTLLKAWEADLDSTGYTSGFQGFLTPTLTACASDDDCIAAYGGVCKITGGACSVGPDCPLFPIEACQSAVCGFPGYAAHCEPGWIYAGRPDYIFAIAGGDLPAVDLSTLDYRYASADSDGAGVAPPSPFVPQYCGTLRLDASADCKGTFSVGFKPTPSSVMVDTTNAFIPLLGLVPAQITCPISRCCTDLTGAGECWENVTEDQCNTLGTPPVFWDTDQTNTCADDCCACLNDGMCQDGSYCNGRETCVDCTCQPGTPIDIDDSVACTDDACIEDGPVGAEDTGHVENVPNDTLCDDGGNCNGVETCNATTGCETTTPAPDCDDGDPCSTDSCVDPAGTCSNIVVDTVPCPSGDPLIDCGPEATACGAGTCGEAICCLCAPQCPDLNVVIGDLCVAGGKVVADVVMGEGSAVTGAQFTVEFDASCLEFNGAVNGAQWPQTLAGPLDVGPGAIFMAVGVNPFGGVGVTGPSVVTSLSFTKLGDCQTTGCGVCIVDGANPYDTNLTFEITNVQQSCVPVGTCDAVLGDDTVGITVPGNDESNADCDFQTANFGWDAPSCSSACATCDIVCTGTGPNGEDFTGMAMGGGEHPIGTSTYSCTATGTGPCNGSAADGWTVTVNDAQSLDVTVQLSPILSGDVSRCIKFELFEDCVQAPIVLEQDLFFGGAFDHIGHFTSDIKVPVGQFACITARDQHHSLRSCAYPDCVGGVYSAMFKGDPFFGGNWLVQGNLDGHKKDNPAASHDVIDILDFGAFVVAFGDLLSPNTSCATVGGHADINGDGIVDAADFAFVSMNFLTSSKDCCCGAATATVKTPVTSMSVRDLRAANLLDLIVADLNKDGVVDSDDMTDFMAGKRPAVGKEDVRIRGGDGLQRR